MNGTWIGFDRIDRFGCLWIGCNGDRFGLVWIGLNTNRLGKGLERLSIGLHTFGKFVIGLMCLVWF